MARRFIVNQSDIININENVIKITGKEVKHIQVLRNNIGDIITLNEYICKIIEIKRDYIVLEKISSAPKVGEPNINITLYIAMLKNDKLDFVVQKATEIGCKKIVPFISKNTIVKLDEKSAIKRKEKLQIIADEACKQCGRTDKVTVENIITFKEVAKTIKENTCILAYENEKKSLKSTLKEIGNLSDISVIIGPEGGFDRDEINLVENYSNMNIVSLGSRILRAETAALNLLSIIVYEFEMN